MHKEQHPGRIIGFPGPLRYAKYQRPLDETSAALARELMVVTTHIGHLGEPLLQKHANFRSSGSTCPKRSSTPSTAERSKPPTTPIQDFQRCVDEALKLPLRPGILRRYMRENALETFRME